MLKHLFGLLFLCLMALPFLAATLKRNAPPEGTPESVEEQLTIISPHNREVRMEYSRAFAAYMMRTSGRQVSIRWLDVGGASRILKELESRFATTPDNIGIDLLFGGGVDPYLGAKRHGWLAPTPVSEELLSDIPATCAGFPVYDPEGFWYGVALSSFGIIRNHALIERLNLPMPTEWEDLARPEFATWIGGGDPRSSGSVHACYEIILQAYGFEKGWRILAQMAANTRAFGDDGGEAPRAVACGEVAAGMVIGQYAQKVIHAIGDDRLSYVLPTGTTIITPDAIAMLKGAPHAELSGRFIRFSLSEEGQRILFQSPGKNGQTNSLYRMPIRRALYRDPEAPKVDPFSFQARFTYDNEKGDRRWRILNDLLGVWLIDAHPQLSAVWQTKTYTPLSPKDQARLFAPPMTEDEIVQLTEQWGNSEMRLNHMSDWKREARERYASFEHAIHE